jgi:YD repeat-containing protein
LNNSGVYDLQGDVNLTSSSKVSNTGTFRKSSGTSTSSVGSFNNTGTVEVHSGTLTLSSVSQVSGSTLTAGTWNVFANATLSLPGAITTNQGSITLDGVGSTLAAISGLRTNNGSFSLLDGRSFTASSGFANAGRLTLGAGDTLNVTGAFTQSAAGSLGIALGGTPASGQYGHVASTGAATLAGTLNVSLANGFGPIIGNTYPILTFASSSGSFATVNGLTLGRFPLFSTQVSSTNFSLVTAANTADLTPTDVEVLTPSVHSGDIASITYTVKNTGGMPATGDWYDMVYLSLTSAIGTGTGVYGFAQHHVGDVASLATYTETVSFPLSGIPPGQYTVFVLADSRGLVPDANRANNVGKASTTVTVTVPALAIGGTVSGTIANGEDIYYHLVVAPGSDITIAATYAASTEAELYIRYGALPDRSTYDQTVADLTNQGPQLVLSNAQGGDYYILLHGREDAGAGQSFTIAASQAQLQITGISPNQAENTFLEPDAPTGSVPNTDQDIFIAGTSFTASTTVSLVATDGTVFAASSATVLDPNDIDARFDLTNVPVGSYVVRATDGSHSASASTELQVVNATILGGPVQVFLKAPSRVFVGSSIGVDVTIRNDTGGDAPLPFLELDASNVAAGEGTQQFVDTALPLLVPPRNNLFDADLTFGTSLDPSPQTAGTTTNSTLGVIDLNQLIDWSSQKDSLRPATIAPAAWDAIFANLQPVLGKTAGDFFALLERDAGALQDSGESVTGVSRLLQFEVGKANDQMPSSTLDSAVDLAFPGPGPSLTFARSFQSTIDGRYNLGPLGRGWVDNWDYSATTETGGGVVITEGAVTRYFGLQTNGSYVGMPGDTGALTLVNGAYHLQEQDGSSTVFRTNGSLDYVQDANQNRITAGYDSSNRLATLTHSDGSILTIAYNAQGRISQVTDPAGRVATYSYDASGEHLLSVTTPEGTTQYTYSAETTGPQAHELASVTTAAGTHVYLTYDAQGRLKTEQGDNSGSLVTITYDLASFRVTDTQGNAETYFYDTAGHITRTVGALGPSTLGIFDNLGHLTGVETNGGGQSTFTYNTQNNTVTSTDPNGAQQTSVYSPTFNKLLAFTDANGNTTKFGYDANGNPNLITMPDGSTQQDTYDSHGIWCVP